MLWVIHTLPDRRVLGPPVSPRVKGNAEVKGRIEEGARQGIPGGCPCLNREEG